MKKSIVCILLAIVFTLSACAGSDKGQAEALPVVEEVMAAPTPAITEAVVETKVEEFEEEKFEFEPANLGCEIPTGFKASDFPGEYLHKSYPKDVSSINQVISESAENPLDKTKEEYAESIEKEYYDAYGEEVKINITQYDKIMVDGRPGLWIMYNYNFRDDEYNVLTVVLYNGSETNYVTYLEGPGADWMDKFIESAKTITFVPIS